MLIVKKSTMQYPMYLGHPGYPINSGHLGHPADSGHSGD